MKTHQSASSRWLTVAAFAAAMAWVESAVVFYLRTMVNRIEPYQPDPLPIVEPLAAVELVREVATMIMLLAVGALAGRPWRQRLGFSGFAFGVWDILYYAFLKVMCGWPHSLLDWDVLFLLPLPWWGPVLAPMSIAVLMILWGTAASRAPAELPRDLSVSWRAWAASGVGILIALYVFMADAISVAGQGPAAIRGVLPAHFNWRLFLPALVLMSVPVVQEWRRFCRRSEQESGSSPELEPAVVVWPANHTK